MAGVWDKKITSPSSSKLDQPSLSAYHIYMIAFANTFLLFIKWPTFNRWNLIHNTTYFSMPQIEHLGINLTKHNKTWAWAKLKISDDIRELNKWKDTHSIFIKREIQYCQDVRSFFPKLIYRLNSVSWKIQANYFIIIDKLILRFTWRSKRTHIILKNRVRGLMLPNFKT